MSEPGEAAGSAAAEPGAGPQLVTAAEVGAELGVSGQCVYNWARRGCPAVHDGTRLTFDVDAVRAWKLAQPTRRRRVPALREEGDAQPAAPRDGRTALENRKLRALTELREHEVGVRRGLYLKRDQIESALADCFADLRRQLLVLPARLAAEVADQPRQVAEEVLRREIEAALLGASRAAADASSGAGQ